MINDYNILEDLKSKKALYTEEIGKIKAELTKREEELRKVQRLIELVDKHGFFG